MQHTAGDVNINDRVESNTQTRREKCEVNIHCERRSQPRQKVAALCSFETIKKNIHLLYPSV